MLRFRRLLALVPAPLALLALVSSAAAAQGGTPLHLAADRFDFVDFGDPTPPTKPLRVHNGGKDRFTDVKLTRLMYADSAKGAGWLVPIPRQTSVAPDELAIVGTLCVDAAGLAAGTYRATAGVVSNEVMQPVPLTITLIVSDAGVAAKHVGGRCATVAK